MPFGVIQNARKVFPAQDLGRGALEDLVALDDASFTFEEGEVVSLLGPSGCGKTTLLRSIMGLIPIASGEMHFDEDNLIVSIHQPQYRRKDGFGRLRYAEVSAG